MDPYPTPNTKFPACRTKERGTCRDSFTADARQPMSAARASCNLDRQSGVAIRRDCEATLGIYRIYARPSAGNCGTPPSLASLE
jgi:hypothetical protein